jgi:hypothetical protein
MALMRWFVWKTRATAGVTALLLMSAGAGHASDPPASFVVHISMDGLRSDAITAPGPDQLPNFRRLRTEGAFTANARPDHDHTFTLPNHVCQLTGRPVEGGVGHNWIDNFDPGPEVTLASNKGFYIAGVFDVAHDHGLRTGLFASKSKFSLFATSWDGTNGAPDVTGPDNGRSKIDVFELNESDTSALVDSLVGNMSTQAFQYVFLHLRDPDATGHMSGWDITPGSAYSETIRVMDDRLGVIFRMIETNSLLTGRTALIVTADHGGTFGGHGDPTAPEEYTIPFYVWGPGVMAGADLYALNPASRMNPGTTRPDAPEGLPPIHNAEAANVALQMLGLEPVPGSVFNSAQDLAWGVPPPPDFRLTFSTSEVVMHFTMRTNVLYDIQSRGDLVSGVWTNDLVDIPGHGTGTNIALPMSSPMHKYYRLRLH